LLGLKELQKSWDLNYWVLEIFFHCLDDSTAEYLQLSEEKNNNSGNNKTTAPGFANANANTNLETSMTDITTPPRQFLRNIALFPDTIKPSSAMSNEEQPPPPPQQVQQDQPDQQQEEILNEQRPQPWSDMLSLPSNEVDIDLSEPYLFDEEFARNFGSCTPRLDALNSSNLDFLYRYL
jgi:hypothetical protein